MIQERPGGIPDTLQALAVPIDSLRPYAKNPRNGDIDAIQESLRHHGQYRPIVVRTETREILAGNHTYMAAMAEGWEEIAATFVSCDDDQAARIVLVDNRLNDKAKYDDGLLVDILTSFGGDFLGTGYTPDDFSDLLARISPPTLDQLRQKYGDHEERELWPWLKVQVSPETLRKWEDLMKLLPGDDQAVKTERLLDAVDVSVLIGGGG